ncbi:MAG: DUF58 domain-containing protein [Lamprobacter sp.]|uniref:DUF58 domain-containing protein n=1 Tax=Lamprobacter sp. TaxID=3100796 RepID=UPI002B25AE18|nr:DUF58 domain-containing protein [Lamprobacter sp.]MEA3641624.1 DUF58 domain-containing protein [Lamprobacter sp.]
MSLSDDERVYRVDADELVALRSSGERLRPACIQSARSALAGAHRSRFHGRGMDYRESRHYQPGDDIRNMDWRITARSGHAHVKVFDEERERPVVVLVDFGTSMSFASQGVFKSVQAARLAALIGWSAISHGDRIGALLFTDAAQAGQHAELSPAGGRRGQMRLIRALAQAGAPEVSWSGQANSGSGLTAALLRLRRVARPGSLVFLLSDFYSADTDTKHHLSRLAQHSDVNAIQLLDPLELAPPPPGRYGISDGRRRAMIDTRSPGERERYARELARHHQGVRQLTVENGIGLLQCLTTDDPAARLAQLLAGPDGLRGALDAQAEPIGWSAGGLLAGGI